MSRKVYHVVEAKSLERDTLSEQRWQSLPSDDPVQVRLTRERGEKSELSPDYDAQALGLAAVRVERGDGSIRLRLVRSADAGPGLPTRVRVAALVIDQNRAASRLVTRELEVPAGGKSVELDWNGEALL